MPTSPRSKFWPRWREPKRMSSASEIPIRPSIAFAAHPARRFTCSAGIFHTPSWSCSTGTGARPRRFCSALLPWSTRTLLCLPRTMRLPTGALLCSRHAKKKPRKKERRWPLSRWKRSLLPREMPKRRTWPASSKRHNGARVADGTTSAYFTARTFTATALCRSWPSGKFPSPSRTWTSAIPPRCAICLPASRLWWTRAPTPVFFA